MTVDPRLLATGEVLQEDESGDVRTAKPYIGKAWAICQCRQIFLSNMTFSENNL